MNRIQFDVEFDKLKANPWEFAPRGDKYDAIADLYWDKLRNYNPENWRLAVSKLIETDKRFPTFNRIYAMSKDLIGNKEDRNYEPCKACGNSGYVSMLLSFEQHNDGQSEQRIKSKHYWAIERQRQLVEETGDRYYCYSFYCRCAKGEDLYLIRGQQGYQISHDEFKELLSE